MTTVKGLLNTEFEMNEIGQPSYMLGVQISRDREKGTLTINQYKYIGDILDRFGMAEAYDSPTPMTAGIKLERITNIDLLPEEEKGEMLSIPYKQAVGSLIFLSCLTRPDLAYPVHVVSQHLSAYNQTHWGQVKRILRYIKGTRSYGTTYRRSNAPFELLGYSDSDWAADIHTRKSLGAYLFLIAGGPFSWACKRNQTICLSSTEAEYKALSAAAREAVWDRRCLMDMGQEQRQPTTILCDNMGAIALAGNPVFHGRSKHIEIYHHYVREVAAAGSIALKYVNTTENLADALTKSLSADLMARHCSSMGLVGLNSGRSSSGHCQQTKNQKKGGTASTKT